MTSPTEQYFLWNYTKSEWNIKSHFCPSIRLFLLEATHNLYSLRKFAFLWCLLIIFDFLRFNSSGPVSWKAHAALLIKILVKYLLRDLDLDARQENQNLSLSDESDNYYDSKVGSLCILLVLLVIEYTLFLEWKLEVAYICSLTYFFNYLFYYIQVS